MRTFTTLVISLLLVTTLALSSFTSVSAAGSDPWVTPVSGDKDFSVTVIPVASLPGITESPGGMLIPLGFPAGEKQFGSDGIRVSDFESGKATTCFSFTGAGAGWSGQVSMWDGAKWVLLPTTIKSHPESLVSSACASITKSGTYTFLKYWQQPDRPEVPEVPEVAFVLPPECENGGTSYSIGYSGPVTFQQLSLDFVDPGHAFVPVSYIIIDSNSLLAGDLTGSMMTDGSGNAYFVANSWYLVGPQTGPIIFTIRAISPYCHFDTPVNAGFFYIST